MKTLLMSLVVLLTLGLASMDADAARRFGGGGNLGKQRPAPTMREAPKEATAPAAAKPAQPAAAPAPGAPQPKPGFMSRFGGLLAGLGIGALLGSLFGGHLGGAGGLIMFLLLGAILYMVVRAMMSRRAPTPSYAGPRAEEPVTYSGMDRPPVPESANDRPAFSGIGSALPPGEAPAAPVRDVTPESSGPLLPAGFNRDAFLRVAKTSFIRLQAANDAKDLDDIRDYTTPEMYAEIAMQLQDRGDVGQKVEVVNVDAQLVDYAVEGDFEYASVRFYGLIRESKEANPEPFDEIWHVRKKKDDARAPWLIAGIQQVS
ncbi:MAG TPA: Tim44-like domain-containing protein [Usitatibacter sp.]|nr:Tim44-like domain-containing protein [Usitatibacter sp.]